MFGSETAMSSRTAKLAKIGQGCHPSRGFWRFAQLPVESWVVFLSGKCLFNVAINLRA